MLFSKISAAIKLLRPAHYLKNFLIFIPVFFSKNLFSVDKILKLFYMLIPFCFICSIIYIINDISDVEKDKLHPTKCTRPIASGKISVKFAWIIVAVLICISILLFVVSYFFEFFNIYVIALLGIYLAVNLAYSVGHAKDIPLLDVAILASGYLIRIFYGACVIDVEVSQWLYFTVLAGALFLGIGKRRNEFSSANGKSGTRKVLEKYNYEFLDKNMYVCAALVTTFYALWTIQFENKKMIWTVPVVIFILMKYSLNIENKDSEGDPMNVVLKDKVILFLSIVLVAAIFLIVYVL